MAITIYYFFGEFIKTERIIYQECIHFQQSEKKFKSLLFCLLNFSSNFTNVIE